MRAQRIAELLRADDVGRIALSGAWLDVNAIDLLDVLRADAGVPGHEVRRLHTSHRVQVFFLAVLDRDGVIHRGWMLRRLA